MFNVVLMHTLMPERDVLSRGAISLASRSCARRDVLDDAARAVSKLGDTRIFVRMRGGTAAVAVIK